MCVDCGCRNPGLGLVSEDYRKAEVRWSKDNGIPFEAKMSSRQNELMRWRNAQIRIRDRKMSDIVSVTVSVGGGGGVRLVDVAAKDLALGELSAQLSAGYSVLTDEDLPLCAECNHTRTLHEDNTGGGDGACGADDCGCDGYASAEDVATGPLCLGCNHSGSQHFQGICMTYECECKSLVLGMVGNATLGLKNRLGPDERPELQRARETFEQATAPCWSCKHARSYHSGNGIRSCFLSGCRCIAFVETPEDLRALVEARKPTVSGRAAAILWAKGKPK